MTDARHPGGAALEGAFRDHWGVVVATLVGFLGDIDLAEEAAQEAFAIAARRWPDAGVPEHPRAWLVTTARNRAVDRVRRERTLAAKTARIAAEEEVRQMDAAPSSYRDERLELIFMCCHPALAPEAQIALTLRTLGGLTTAEIARSFLVPESTMQQRLVRAKRKVKVAGIPFRIPTADLLPERLTVVLSIIELIFNEGYGGRSELAAEALWLGRALADLLPDQPEVHGLVAVMLYADSRRDARLVDGELVLLAQQDRGRWDLGQMERGRDALGRALELGGDGPYVVHAAIAAAHAEPEPDWRRIAILYGELLRLTGSPIVELNRAVAVAEVEGAAVGLELVDRLSDALGDYRYFHATRGELLARLGRDPEATVAYGRALDGAADADGDRAWFERRLRELGGPEPA